ncbi:unnamed protein product [Arctia plantaginis]|uniref:MADF domain-containing protein n=1 Tax=Arctia plantaginis TaxID=874455 RepID=A0A8S0ZGR2_ARCPL|nr:unnamed protein product [Arctia plantaginis]
MDINIENLIKVIRKQRVLYDNNHKDYYDRPKKRQVWDHVCSLLLSRWDTFDDGRKLIYCKEVQKKWQSLRDCFRRELIIQKTQSSSNGKKKYKYFDALEFLTPYTHSIINETSASSHDEVSFLITDLESNSKDPLSASFAEESREESEEEFATSSRRFMDDDEAFLYSLLPSFKEYGMEQKYLLRIELMKTILKFKQSQNNFGVVKEEENTEDDYYS